MRANISSPVTGEVGVPYRVVGTQTKKGTKFKPHCPLCGRKLSDSLSYVPGKCGTCGIRITKPKTPTQKQRTPPGGHHK